eukprot:15466449-Alexandrium_andersonii.AAC.1
MQLAVTHGRAAVLVGLQLPGTVAPTGGGMFGHIPRAIGALAKVPAARWIQGVAYGAFCELYSGSASQRFEAMTVNGVALLDGI